MHSLPFTVSQFDVSSNQTSMQYLHQFDMPGIMGSQPVSSVTAPPPQSGAFRMPTPPAQNNQITYVSLYGLC